jgi:hypothetical protein
VSEFRMIRVGNIIFDDLLCIILICKNLQFHIFGGDYGSTEPQKLVVG